MNYLSKEFWKSEQAEEYCRNFLSLGFNADFEGKHLTLHDFPEPSYNPKDFHYMWYQENKCFSIHLFVYGEQDHIRFSFEGEGYSLFYSTILEKNCFTIDVELLHSDLYAFAVEDGLTHEYIAKCLIWLGVDLKNELDALSFHDKLELTLERNEKLKTFEKQLGFYE